VSIIVVDASVIVKWLIPEKDDENDIEQAFAVLEGIKSRQVDICQPPHWLAEVAAVATRLVPQSADEDIRDLCAMKFPVTETPEIYRHASELAHTLGHHLFDTLYHATALSLGNAYLVTADEKYHGKAASHGHILLLRDFRLPA
jgi:predicted nucleic acid-binding protein